MNEKYVQSSFCRILLQAWSDQDLAKIHMNKHNELRCQISWTESRRNGAFLVDGEAARMIWFLWFVLFIWLISFNQKPDKPNKPDEPNQPNRPDQPPSVSSVSLRLLRMQVKIGVSRNV